MSLSVALRLRKLPVVHWLSVSDCPHPEGEKVVVRTQHGDELATLLRVVPAGHASAKQGDAFVKSILRGITAADRPFLQELCERETQALLKAKEIIAQHKLVMRLLKAECLFDQTRMIFYFKSEQKIDFRDLLKALGTAFRVRIELRQIGVRDEAKLLGGLGCCGKEVCCHQFMTCFYPVSTKMAKEQNLSLNPAKLSGVCGRLLCCLAHEHQYYASFHGKFPRIGAEIIVEGERARVMDLNFITRKALVGFYDRRKVAFSLDEVKGRKDAATGRNMWWIQRENESEPDLLQFYPPPPPGKGKKKKKDPRSPASEVASETTKKSPEPRQDQAQDGPPDDTSIPDNDSDTENNNAESDPDEHPVSPESDDPLRIV